jgi:transposase
MSPTPKALQVTLTPEEDTQLRQLQYDLSAPQRTRERAEALRLNAYGWGVEPIARYLDWAPQTVRETIHRWHQRGWTGLWDAPRPGPQRRWQEQDFLYQEQCLEQEQRTYTSAQLADKLARERQIQMHPDHLRRVLKKRASDGNGPGTPISITLFCHFAG